VPKPVAEVPRRVLLALIIGQLGLHAAMAGLRMSAPLMALRTGRSEWTRGRSDGFVRGGAGDAGDARRPHGRSAWLSPAGACRSGRDLDRRVRGDARHLGQTAGCSSRCCASAATFTGAGTNLGLIAIQRTAGHWATDSVQRMRIFSWLGLAPSMSNVVGPVVAGFVIDAAGFRAAFAVMLLLPLLSWFYARRVPRSVPTAHAAAGDGTAWDLLALPGLKRLMLVNLLLSACWDVHTFAVPVLGHERGFSASTIGLVLGASRSR
jgi:hypothetical protein